MTAYPTSLQWLYWYNNVQLNCFNNNSANNYYAIRKIKKTNTKHITSSAMMT